MGGRKEDAREGCCLGMGEGAREKKEVLVATEAAGEGEATAVPGSSGGGKVWENSSRPVMNLLVRGLAEAAAYEELVRDRVSVGGSIEC